MFRACVGDAPVFAARPHLHPPGRIHASIKPQLLLCAEDAEAVPRGVALRVVSANRHKVFQEATSARTQAIDACLAETPRRVYIGVDLDAAESCYCTDRAGC